MKSGRVSSDTPAKCNPPKGPKQSSGAVKHARMTTAAKVENLKGMPK